MKIDPMKILHDEMTLAMMQRSALRYSQDNDFRMSVKAVNAISGDVFELPVQWRSHKEKSAVMAKVSLIAHYARIPAIIVTSDMRCVEYGAFARYYGLEEPNRATVGSLEKFEKEYRRILREHGNEIAKLPRELWMEAIMTWIKGPEIGTKAMTSKYVEGADDRVRWTDTYDSNTAVYESFLVPDYWLPDFAEKFTLPEELRLPLEMIASAFAGIDGKAK